MKSQSTSIKREGCGCGSSGGSCGCGTKTVNKCSCNMPSCGSCAEQGFTRPHFFAGQLLTEDDLEALGNYVVAKNRLHNRMFFGDGVVCGLNVLCHPCGDGKVVVKPGYALDCCGNDIVVSCEQELDVLALLRDLARSQLGGYDCTEPCKPAPTPPVKKPEAQPDNTNEAGRIAVPTHDKPQPKAVAPRKERYCLYIRYCEQLSDLVSPFSTGSACGAAECEPSRVKEGFSFELRCREEEPTKDILAAIVACFGDILKLDRATADSSLLQRESKQLSVAAAAIKASPKVDFTDDHLTQMSVAGQALDQFAGSSPKDSEALLEGARRIGTGAGLLARYAIAESPPATNRATGAVDGLSKLVANAASVLSTAVPSLGQPATPLELAYFQAAEEMAGTSNYKLAPHRRLWAEGVVYSANLEAAYIQALESLRRTLLNNLKPGRATADCTLRADLAELQLPLPGQGGDAGASEQIEKAVVVLVGALLRILLDCVCLAITPPCGGCDDPGVLLACLDVEECKITGICNTSRKLVITSNAIRYWLPPLGWLGEILELACCTLRNGIADATSFRAMAAWLGIGERGGLSLGREHATYAVQSYYGASAPSDNELNRLPKVLAQIARTAANRVDIPDRVAIPSASVGAAPAAPSPAEPFGMAVDEIAVGTTSQRIGKAEKALKQLEKTTKELRSQLDALRADG